MNGSEIRRGAVETLLGRAVRAGLFPGAVAVMHDREGGVVCHAAGRSRVLPAPRPAGPDILYDLASLTKPLATTTLFLLARREGLVGLETRVGEVLDGAGRTPLGGISMEQLLTHTSGLPGWLPLYALAGGRPRAALDALLRVRPVGPPGGQVIYSCPGFLLLGWILERILDRPLEAAFRDLVCRPLGLTGEIGYNPGPGRRSMAGGAADARVEEELLAGMGLDNAVRHLPPVGEGLPDDGNARFLGGAAGNAGLWGTAEAVAALAAQYLPGGGRLLKAGEAALATGNRTPGLEQARGLGWQLGASPGCSAGPALPSGAFGHTGFTGTSVWSDPQVGRVFVLLANRHHPVHRGVELHPLRRRFHALAAGEPARDGSLRSGGSSGG